jgi:predicted metalloendopeptidase
LNSWTEGARGTYNERVKCLIDQYSSYRVPEIEKHFNISEFRLNGLRTIRENIADNGGVKLAFQAFKRSTNAYRDTILVGLESLSSEKIFYLSFAQAFCSVERPAKMRSNVESDLHALSKFRVIGVLSNMEEFSQIWNCPRGSAMNPEKKCALW